MFHYIGFGALLVWLSIQFIAQPLKVWFCTIGSGLKWREKLMIAWIGPRGIVAAAISGLFALKLDQQNIAGAEVLVPLTFIVILGTVVTASLTARPLARLIGEALPEDKGVLLVGANVFSRRLAATLKKQGYRAVIADSDYSEIRQARMEGLETFYGNPVSEAADNRLDLMGIGNMFATSILPEINSLAAVRYRHEFGAGHVYVLQTQQEATGNAQQRLSHAFTGRSLFGPHVSMGDLMQLLQEKAEIFTTRITENFTWDDYQATYKNRGVILLLITSKGELIVCSETKAPQPQIDWLVMGLYRPAVKGGEPAPKEKPATEA
jgi:hypothetical protein